MPVYTYRREDGTTFEIQQKFLDDPLTVCPTTGQKVVRIIQSAGIIFKGSGFYVTDSKNASKSSLNGSSKSSANGSSETTSATNGSSGSEGSSSEAKPETKVEKPAETKAAS